MGIVVESGDNGKLIALVGSVDIGCAQELKAALREQIDAGAEVHVSLQAATYLDVTAVQLLWAAGEAARFSDARFRLVGAVPEAIAAELTDAGFPALPVTVP